MWVATKLVEFPLGGGAIGSPPYPYTLEPVLTEPDDPRVFPIPVAKGMFDPELCGRLLWFDIVFSFCLPLLLESPLREFVGVSFVAFDCLLFVPFSDRELLKLVHQHIYTFIYKHQNQISRTPKLATD